MMLERKDERLEIRLPADLKRRAAEWAERHDENLSAYVRGAIRDAINSDIIEHHGINTDD